MAILRHYTILVVVGLILGRIAVSDKCKLWLAFGVDDADGIRSKSRFRTEVERANENTGQSEWRNVLITPNTTPRDGVRASFRLAPLVL